MTAVVLAAVWLCECVCGGEEGGAMYFNITDLCLLG